MSWNALTDAEIAVGQPIVGDDGNGFGRKVKDCLEYLYGISASVGGDSGVPNGSFEIDSDSDGVPDSWTKALYPGGSGAIYTTSPSHGAQAYKFVHPGGGGNGGGYLTSDYIECSPVQAMLLGFTMWTSAAGMKNIAEITFYTKALASISTTVLLTSTSNPASPTIYLKEFTPPATAAYMKILLIGGYTDTDVAGTAYFDDVFLLRRPGYQPGSVLSFYSDTERNTTATSYTKTKEVRVIRNGTLTIAFDIKASGTETAYGRIYIDGVATGTQRTNASTSYVTFTENIAVSQGNLVQLYLKTSNAAYAAYARNFRFYTGVYDGIAEVTQD